MFKPTTFTLGYEAISLSYIYDHISQCAEVTPPPIETPTERGHIFSGAQHLITTSWFSSGLKNVPPVVGAGHLKILWRSLGLEEFAFCKTL